MNNDKLNKLRSLYSEVSKHSNYQILPNSLLSIMESNDMEIDSRYESERLKYILKSINVSDRSILDVGGNTGFFTFELIAKGAKTIHYYEGNAQHAEFVSMAAEALKLKDKIIITNEYLSFDKKQLNKKFDIVLLLNVLHHYGDDYGNNHISIEEAREEILQQLNSLSATTKYLVLQLGFNWKGNRDCCLFEHGTKLEVIEYISNGIQDHWEIEVIGIAEKSNNLLQYVELNDQNKKRNDSLGEFLNRPIIILKSLVKV